MLLKQSFRLCRRVSVERRTNRAQGPHRLDRFKPTHTTGKELGPKTNTARPDTHTHTCMYTQTLLSPYTPWEYQDMRSVELVILSMLQRHSHTVNKTIELKNANICWSIVYIFRDAFVSVQVSPAREISISVKIFLFPYKQTKTSKPQQSKPTTQHRNNLQI